ncbi:hypothetical protein BLNAU_21956 [Blattamonas nauphoetae]|uniref:Uncharacterized protein n=1 Tax=Blattamonas nauphoetae TaxID=2049346 RepID=A0ABQ9WUF9_9EUKA|nr:hypothetical protein BLNAU_21956 [Blattamonas nauphoetae]
MAFKRISFAINHQSKFNIQVPSNMTFEKFKSKIHAFINAKPLEELYPLIIDTLPLKERKKLQHQPESKSLKKIFSESFTIEKADNHNCIIVFPIYPPQYLETSELSEYNLEWIATVQKHGCRCDSTITMDNLTLYWPQDDFGHFRPLNVIYTPFKRHHLPINVPPCQTSPTIIQTSIATLVEVQKTHPRTIILPIQDENFEKGVVYVRDSWVDYSKGMTDRFIASEGAIGITTPIPHLVYDEDAEHDDSVIHKIPAIARVPHWVENDPKSHTSFKNLLGMDPNSDDVHTQYFVEGHPGTGNTEMQLYFLYRLIHSFVRLCEGIPPLFIKVDKTQPNELVVEDLKRDLSQFQDVDYFPVIGLFDSVEPLTVPFFTWAILNERTRALQLRQHLKDR